MAPTLLSPAQVARQCGLSRRAIYRAIDRGELPAARVCNRLRIRTTDLHGWLDRCRVTVTAPPTAPTPRPAPVAGGLRRLLDD